VSSVHRANPAVAHWHRRGADLAATRRHYRLRNRRTPITELPPADPVPASQALHYSADNQAWEACSSRHRVGVGQREAGEATMSSTRQALAIGRPVAVSRSRRPPWRGRLQGSDTSWAIAFVVPYVAVFAAFVIYPVVYGLWMGSNPSLYGVLFSDPRYLVTAVNTLLFVAIGVNVKMFLAFLLSGFFMSRSWWVRTLLAIYLLPWALPAVTVFTSIHFMLVTQWGLLDSLWRAVTGEDGPLFLTSEWLAMGANIVSYIWKWMPFWTLIFVAARMAIPQDIYDAAEIDGANGYKRLIYVTFPLLANVYLISTLLSTVWTLGDFPTVYFVSSGAPARLTDVLATYGFHEAFDFGYPNLGVAAMMSALPVIIPLVILLMRRVRATGVQL
jgi:multiple sugar transport system permease protein